MRRIGHTFAYMVLMLLAAVASTSGFQAAQAGPGDVVTTLADGSSEAKLVFDGPGSKTANLRVPFGWSTSLATMVVEGLGNGGGGVDQKDEASRYEGTYSVRAQQFKPNARSLSGVDLYLARTSQKTDGFTVEIRADDGKGYPSGTVLTSATKSVDVGKYRWERFDVPAIAVEPGLPYWIVGYVVSPDKVSYPAQPSLGDYGYYVGLSTGDEYPTGDSADLVASTTGLRWEKFDSRKTWDLMFRTISNVEYFPTNPTVGLAGDGDVAWRYSGEFGALAFSIDLTPQVTRYLLLNGGAGGKIDTEIPIVITSDSAGAIRVRDVRIEKRVDAPEAAAPLASLLASSPTAQPETPSASASSTPTPMDGTGSVTPQPSAPAPIHTANPDYFAYPTSVPSATGTPAPTTSNSPTEAPNPTASPAASPIAARSLGPMRPRFVPPSDITFKSLGFGDITVQGVDVSKDLYLPGASGYPLADGSYLKLVYGHSGILLEDRSTMIVRLNGVPLTTVRLNRDNANVTEIKLILPKDKLVNGFNHIRIDFYMRILDGACTDELNNPALNATIFGESMIHYEYASLIRTKLTPAPTLADYPAPFVYSAYSWPDEMIFVVPDAPTPAELTAASSIAAKLGQIAAGKLVTATLATSSQLDKERKEGYNLIFVGKAQSLNLAQELTRMASLEILEDAGKESSSLKLGEERLAPDSGVIRLVSSPWNPANWVLIVAGATDRGVQRAGTALSTKTYLGVLKGDQAVITQDPQPGALLAKDDPRLPKEVTLGNMGISDILVSGMGELSASSLSFSSPAPNPYDDAYVDLVLSHSPLLVAAESSLRVDLNGLPVKSIQLDDGTLQPTKLRVDLPSSMLRPGPNALTFRLTMYGHVAGGCGAVDKSRSWTVVHSESLIHLPPAGPEPPLSLGLFPYPFLGTGPRLESAYLDRNALVLPDDPGEWQDSPLLAIALGRYSTADVVNLPTVRSRDVSNLTRDQRNVILYGTWGATEMLDGASASLPLQFVTGQGKTFRVPEEETVSVSDVVPTGMVGTIPSPWNKGKALLIVSGDLGETLRWSSSALSKSRMGGNLLTVTREDDVNTFYGDHLQWPWN